MYMFPLLSSRNRQHYKVTVAVTRGLQPTGLLRPWVFQARILEWLPISFSKGSSWPRDRTQVSCVACTAGRSFTHRVIGEALKVTTVPQKKKKLVNQKQPECWVRCPWKPTPTGQCSRTSDAWTPTAACPGTRGWKLALKSSRHANISRGCQGQMVAGEPLPVPSDTSLRLRRVTTQCDKKHSMMNPGS